MGKRKKLRKRLNPLYLNANLLYGECLNIIRKPNWNRNIKIGTVFKLSQKYDLATSLLTRMEVIQRLCREENKTVKEARATYSLVLDQYGILEIAALHKLVDLNDSFLDFLAKSNLDFKDAIHLVIAKKKSMPLCTHDKKLRGNFSNHETKERFYEKVYKPGELI